MGLLYWSWASFLSTLYLALSSSSLKALNIDILTVPNVCLSPGSLLSSRLLDTCTWMCDIHLRLNMLKVQCFELSCQTCSMYRSHQLRYGTPTLSVAQSKNLKFVFDSSLSLFFFFSCTYLNFQEILGAQLSKK